MFQNLKVSRNHLLIILFGAIFFIPFLGRVHLFDWDEINFAEAAREMIVTGNYSQVQINYEPFMEKPPLFIWMQVVSMKIFGINEFAARLPNAICGIITLLIVFNIGRKLFDEKFGILWLLSFAGSLLPHFYFKSGIIDPWFNLYTFLGIYFFMELLNSEQETRNKKLILSAIFLGLAVLTKGPIAPLIFTICFFIYWSMKKFRKIISLKEIVLFFLIVAAISFGWFGIYAMKSGFLREFINYQIRLLTSEDAGHGGPLYYHIIVLLLGCFPSSIFFIFQLFRRTNESKSDEQKSIFLWMKILFWVVLILFSIVKTKIVHYSSLCYFPITFLAAYYLYQLLSKKHSANKLLPFGILFLGGIIASVITLLPYLAIHNEIIIPYIKDDFAINCLNARVNWTLWEMSVGFFYLLSLATVTALMVIKKYAHGILLLLASTIITLQLVLVLFVPKIERYSQGAAIDFYQSIQSEDCYVQVLGFKSYAHLFYSKLKKENKIPTEEILLNNNTYKRVYFVCKSSSEKYFSNYPSLKLLGKENGFVFFKKEPSGK